MLKCISDELQTENVVHWRGDDGGGGGAGGGQVESHNMTYQNQPLSYTSKRLVFDILRRL